MSRRRMRFEGRLDDAPPPGHGLGRGGLALERQTVLVGLSSVADQLSRFLRERPIWNRNLQPPVEDPEPEIGQLRVLDWA